MQEKVYKTMTRNYTKNCGKGARCKEEMRETLRKEFRIIRQLSNSVHSGVVDYLNTRKQKKINLGRIYKQDVE